MKANAKIAMQFRILQEHLVACEQAIDIIGSEDYESWNEIELSILKPIHDTLSDVSDYAADLTECAQIEAWFDQHSWTLELELGRTAGGAYPDYQYYLYPAGQPDCQVVEAHVGFPTIENLREAIENTLKLTANDIAVNWLDFMEAPIPDEWTPADGYKRVEDAAEKLMAELPELLKWLDR